MTTRSLRNHPVADILCVISVMFSQQRIKQKLESRDSKFWIRVRLENFELINRM